MFKKTFKLFLILAIAFAVIIPTAVSTNIIVAKADGRGEFAAELTHGTVLHEKNADERMPMASTTKIMTALIIAEDCDLNEVITVPDEAVGVEGSSVYLKHGEVLSVRDLLYGLMLRSGNDCAAALAIHHSNSVEKFVAVMNKKAATLGASSTNFTNPSGLPDDNHYTTARDLCKIARYAMQNEIFSQVVGSTSYVGDYRSYTNKNKILHTLEGANGVKTGYTVKAGRCLVSSAKRGNMDVICVVLNCHDMYERSERIINDSFKKYCVEELSKDTVYNYNGKAYTLSDNYSIFIERDIHIEYKVLKTDELSHDGKSDVKLQIYSEKGLIFSEFLYSI